ncbi:hypothetical protein [Streptomyces microflavus]|nr:hypothetical protein [Streptomyces microflavus]
MTGPPPCLWSAPCLYDDEEGACPCETEPAAVERDIVTVPVGDYL